MLTFAAKYANNVFSQFGEDGIIEEILHRLKKKTGHIIEFGAHNGKFCSNARNLILQNWTALLIEGDPDRAKECWALYNYRERRDKVNVYCDYVLPENVNEMIGNCDILSIDVDGIDAAIWKEYTGTPDIVIIEINSSINPLNEVFADPDQGSSFKSMWFLGNAKDYLLLCHTGNMIWIRKEHQKLFPELFRKNGSYIHPLNDIDLFFNKSWLK